MNISYHSVALYWLFRFGSYPFVRETRAMTVKLFLHCSAAHCFGNSKSNRRTITRRTWLVCQGSLFRNEKLRRSNVFFFCSKRSQFTFSLHPCIVSRMFKTLSFLETSLDGQVVVSRKDSCRPRWPKSPHISTVCCTISLSDRNSR